MARLNSPEELERFRKKILAQRDPNKPCISICAGAGCVASGADEVIAAFQSEIENQGLKAEVDTKPELQIYADDVQCRHGATVGQLDALALFYLQSRGIAKKDAEALLVHAFVSELLTRIACPAVQAVVQSLVLAQLNWLVRGDSARPAAGRKLCP